MEDEMYPIFEAAFLNAGIKKDVVDNLEEKTKIADVLESPTQLVPLLKGMGVRLTDYVGRDFRGQLFKDEIFNVKLTDECLARLEDIGRTINDGSGLKRAKELFQLGKKGIKALYFELTIGDLYNVCNYEKMYKDAA